ncbi:MAG: hypothetical protein A2107_10555 [Verrucomicrobia bacterium GWF2_62_7]|nr:MAG: hypothetical protein A2107_10555 [Verrucomicrobia bacterium GWF2_62_7]
MNTNRLQLLALAAALLAPVALHAQFSQPMRDVENPAQNAYVTQREWELTNVFSTNIMVNATAPPVGKRLTVESLGLRCLVDPNVTSVNATVTFRMRNSPNESLTNATFPIQMARQGAVFNDVSWVGTFNGRAFHDNPGSAAGPTVQVFRVPTGAPMSCTFTIMGGLTNLPLQ